jgi:hypothetical protein
VRCKTREIKNTGLNFGYVFGFLVVSVVIELKRTQAGTCFEEKIFIDAIE